MHLFLTGRKGVGKSTLIRGLLRGYKGALGGFFTVKCTEVRPEQTSVHLLRAGSDETPGENNLLFCCGGPSGLNTAERFDRLGVCAIESGATAQLLVMDELGPHEGEAEQFCQAVFRALDGDTPILGVLQQAESPFLKQIASHPRVQVIEVTEQNRNALAKTLILPVKT